MSYTGNPYSNHHRPGYPEYDRRDPDRLHSDHYRPRGEINTYRDRDRDRGWDRERSREREQGREGRSRERSRDRGWDWDYHEQERKRGRDADRDKMAGANNNPRKPDNLRVDTARIPTGPRAQTSKDSPMSARSMPSTARPTPTEPSAPRKASISAANSLAGPGSPKGLPAPATKSTHTNNIAHPQAKDPHHQELLDAIVKLGEAAQNQSHCRSRWEKAKREFDKQKPWLDKHLEKQDDFPGRIDYECTFNKSLKKEIDDLNRKLAECDETVFQAAQTVVAIIYRSNTANNTQPMPAVAEASSKDAEKVSLSNAENALSSNLAKELAELKSQMATNHNELAKFKEIALAQQKQSAEQAKTIEQLERDRDSAAKTSEELKHQLKMIKSTNTTPQSLQEQFNKFNAQLATMKADIKNVDQFSKSEGRKRQDFEAAHKASLLGKADGAKMSGLINKLDEVTKEQTELKKRINHLSHPPGPAATVRDPSQENSELKGIVGPLTTRLDVCEKSMADLQMKKDPVDGELAGEMVNLLNIWADNDMENFVKRAEQEAKAIKESVAELKTTQGRQETSLNERVDNLRTGVIEMVEKMSDAVGQMVDEAVAKVEAAAPGNSKPVAESTGAQDPSNTPQSASVQNLETQMRTLSVRVDAIDSHRLPEKCAHLENLVRQLQERQQQQQGQLHQLQETQHSHSEASKQETEALQLAVKTLNAQWSNMQTKGMAEIILAQLNPFSQKQYNLYTKLEQELKMFRVEVKNIADVVAAALNGSKRPASPTNGVLVGPAAKRQRIDGSLQPQLQSRPSPSSRQSSLSRENIPPRDED